MAGDERQLWQQFQQQFETLRQASDQLYQATQTGGGQVTASQSKQYGETIHNAVQQIEPLMQQIKQASGVTA